MSGPSRSPSPSESRSPSRGSSQPAHKSPKEPAHEERNAPNDAAATTAAAPVAESRPGRTPDENKVYVKGFQSGTKEDELKAFFGRCGSVCDIFIKDSSTGVFAFVGFENRSSVDEAVKLDGTEFNNSTLTIEPKNKSARVDDRKCFACGRVGHIGSRCPYGGRQGKRTCFKCGKLGHTQAECRGGTDRRDDRDDRRYDDRRDDRRYDDRRHDDDRYDDRRDRRRERSPRREERRHDDRDRRDERRYDDRRERSRSPEEKRRRYDDRR